MRIMGGRKAARVEKIVGKGKKLQPLKKDFLDSLKTQEPNKIVSSTVKYYTSSSSAIDNLVKATELFDFIREESPKSELSYQERKELVTKKWAEIKEENKVETTSELDRIFIESATKVIRRGKK